VLALKNLEQMHAGRQTRFCVRGSGLGVWRDRDALLRDPVLHVHEAATLHFVRPRARPRTIGSRLTILAKTLATALFLHSNFSGSLDDEDGEHEDGRNARLKFQ
jgi:hypothetical protein